MKKELPYKIESPEPFLKKEQIRDIYTFPFKAVDDTPGGSNLGGMYWSMEFFKGKKNQGRYYIEKILLWTGQTRDKRYYGKVFEIPCYTEIICGFHSENDVLRHISSVSFCEIHKSLVLRITPESNHKELVIETGSSIMNDIYFK